MKPISKDAMTIILLGVMAVILFTKKTATMGLMAFDATNISGWWDGLSSNSQSVVWIVAGILFVTIIVQIWYK